MQNGIFAGISRQAALQSQMDVVANNIANMSTPGYRQQNLVFQQYLSKAQNNGNGLDNTDDRVSMVTDYGQYQSTAPGPIEQTGNPLNVAISGAGYFGVQTPSGTAYTRDGNFQLNASGQLVTGTGLPVSSAGGSAITIPKDAREIKIGRDGTVSTDKGTVGQLMVVEFANEQDLEASGNGMYQLGKNAQSTPTPSTTSTVIQNALEGSNVQPIVEMTRMVSVARAYEMTQNMLSTEGDRESTMIQHLTKVS